MNCLDFRRVCLVEPTSRDPRIYLHLYHCPACRAYRKQVLRAEERMHVAMRIPVPEGLGNKVMFDSEMQAHQSRSSYVQSGWSWAAVALLLVISLGVVFSGLNSRMDVVPALTMHMADDPLHMSPAQADARVRLDQVMRHLGGQWQGAKPPITHATLCLIREQPAAHLVVRGRQGPVTVFLMPGIRAREREQLQVGGQVAEVRHLSEGSIALFGYPDEDLQQIERRFADAIRWSSTLAKNSGVWRMAEK